MIHEAHLHGLGVPVFTELGISMTGFAAAASCDIYLDEGELTDERIEIIEEVLGDDANKDELARRRGRLSHSISAEPKAPSHTITAEEKAPSGEVAVAWLPDRHEGELYEELLSARKVPVALRPEDTGPDDGSGFRYGLFVPEEALDAEMILIIKDYLGDLVDKENLDRARRRLGD